MPRIINYTLDCINSRADMYGNCEFAFTYTDHNTGKEVHATVSGNNAQTIPFYLNGGSHEPHDYLMTVTVLPIRQFNRLVKGWEYAGCNGSDLAEYIKKHTEG